MDYKIAILGGGPGGYTAAVRAAQLGMSVVLIEKAQLGGTCLNWGCIPTKALLSCTDVLSKIRNSEEFGIKVENISFDLSRIMERKRQIVESLVQGLDKLFKLRKIEVVRETGVLTGMNEITTVSGRKITAENLIVATGSEPLELPFFNIDHRNVITSNDALSLEEIPEKMLIIGGGVVGCEFAGIFSELGSKITIVEMLDMLLPTEDNQVSRTIQTSFKKKGIDLKLKTRVDQVTVEEENKVKVNFSDGTEETYTKVLSAGGRSLNIKGNGIDEVGIGLDNGRYVSVNSSMQTNIPNIYAIGDITGKLMLAHTAAAQGIAAVSHIAGKDHPVDYSSVPSAIFTLPEIASVGEREQDLKAKGIEYKVSRFSFAANGKAKGLGETEGFVKILTDGTGEKVLGAHIVGPHASDLIHEIVLVKQNNLPLHALTNTVHAHPTLSECVLEAAEGIFKLSIHSI
ncbi:MAG: dihydrolipoyl dehydrogenase [Candidatus Delongbacteria bacterium]|jgi:dihydrolipoamide dehydrogenase|nr:dihydrolipoyl dehydrogenase [Candidatus Delongbacteria bacterium]